MVETPTITRDAWTCFLDEALLGPRPLVGNATVDIAKIHLGRCATPLVTNHRGHADCSWVASLRNAYGPYARAETELVRLSPTVRTLCLAASHAGEALLKAGGLAGGHFPGNWLLATNLHPADLNIADILIMTEKIVCGGEGLPVCIRSLTPCFHGPLLQDLADVGFLLLPSRQVWIVPSGNEWRTHRDTRRDLKLAAANASRWNWISTSEFSDADFAHARRLFARLYRERYPRHNPDYTLDFFRKGAATGWLEFSGLRPAEGGPLSGFIGMLHRDDVSCTPLLGYDLDAPSELGLYRLLTLRAFEANESRGTTLHCSSGAGAFKFSRGAKPFLEFTAVWANHLPAYRRASLRMLSTALSRLVAPYLASHRF